MAGHKQTRKAAAIITAFASALFIVFPTPALTQQRDDLADLPTPGQYTALPTLTQQADELARLLKKQLPTQQADALTDLFKKGMEFHNAGQYSDATQVAQKALQVVESLVGPNHPYVAQALYYVASLYRIQGRYADAETLFKQSLVIRERAFGPNDPAVAQSLNGLAIQYESQGRYTDAEPLYKRALSIREQAFGLNHLDVAQSLSNLAGIYRNLGRYEAAEFHYESALAIYEKILGPDHPDVAFSLDKLAWLNIVQRRYADAEPLAKRALTIQEKTLGPDHPDVAVSLAVLAWLYDSQRRATDAEEIYKRALSIREKAFGRDHSYVAESLNSLAGFYNRQNRLADALPLVRETIKRQFSSKVVALPVLFESRRQHLIGTVAAFDDSYETVQRVSSSAAANAVSKLSARFAAGPDKELAALVRQDQDLTAEADRLDKVIIAAVSKPAAERNAESEDQVRKRIEAIKLERNKLQTVFNQRFPDYVALSKPQPLSLNETQALLADDEALVVFDFDAKSYAWIITRTTTDWVELNITAKTIDTQVKTLRVSLKTEGIVFDTYLAHFIYQETFDAVADMIASKRRLSVVTNGALTSLPLNLLVTKDPSGKPYKDVAWLARSHAITIWPSVANMKVMRGKSVLSSATKPLIAFADPVFSKQESTQVQKKVAIRSVADFYRGTQIDVSSLAGALIQLPGTRQEVRAVAKALNADPKDIKLGLSATEKAVKRARLDQYRIVYFATHGLVAGFIEKFAKAKAEPALALTIPDKPDDNDDGLLTASEVAQLKLDADWVVLSACNTAAEERPGAEALSGLARAFFYAGGRSLVVSHWEVNDEHTARLMTKTFQASARNSKVTHAQALQQSMLAFLRNAKSNSEAHPRNWAAFVVVGEPSLK